MEIKLTVKMERKDIVDAVIAAAALKCGAKGGSHCEFQYNVSSTGADLIGAIVEFQPHNIKKELP